MGPENIMLIRLNLKKERPLCGSNSFFDKQLI